MVRIDWDEYKEFKKYSTRDDNFEILLEFIKSYYNMFSTSEVYATLHADDIAQMMLDKRNICDAEGLEKFFFKL